MRTPFKASRRVAAPLLLATSTLSLFALHCSTDDGTQPIGGTAGATTTAGAGGSASQSGSSGMAGGGVATAGGSVGTAGTVGTAGSVGTAGTVGVSGSSGGGAGGAGGGTAGAAGSGGGNGGNGGSGGSGEGSPLFAAVKTLMAKSCGTGKCHNAASGELDYQAMDGKLWDRLTQPVPAGSKHCIGSKAVVANDANSLLLQAIKAKGAVCTNNGANQTIGQMPDDCPTKGIACLTAAEQKVFSDWVLAGAPK